MSLDESLAPARKRDAGATRAAILQAATQRFALEGFEGVGLREIAAEAGVDAALISRYFGGKDELFSEVLREASDPSDMFEGDPSTFGARIADMLVNDPQDQTELCCLLIMLRSHSTPRAADAIAQCSQERFYGPFADWLGGANAAARARLAGNIIMGVAVARLLTPDMGLSKAQRAVFCQGLAGTLQQIVDG
jgi:AcrR family transcriptional regulator